MTTRFSHRLLLPVLALAGAFALPASDASALTVQECSAKYKAAKAGNTLAGKTWNEFRKSECGDAAAAPAGDAKKAEAKPADAKPADAKPAAPEAKKAPPAASASGAVFPSAIAAAYAKESAGKARMHTCRDQYKANKATNANGGLKWIQKGGGYYSECNKHLKGAA